VKVQTKMVQKVQCKRGLKLIFVDQIWVQTLHPYLVNKYFDVARHSVNLTQELTAVGSLSHRKPPRTCLSRSQPLKVHGSRLKPASRL